MMADLFSVGAGEGSIVGHTCSRHKHISHHISYFIIKSLWEERRVEMGRKGIMRDRNREKGREERERGERGREGGKRSVCAGLPLSDCCSP